MATNGRNLGHHICASSYFMNCIFFFIAIEGFGGVPPIRPLETLHNALSLRQLDTFLEQMTVVPLFKTPASTPPKHPSTPQPSSSTIAPPCPAASFVSSHHPPLKLQSPSNSKCSVVQEIITEPLVRHIL